MPFGNNVAGLWRFLRHVQPAYRITSEQKWCMSNSDNVSRRAFIQGMAGAAAMTAPLATLANPGPDSDSAALLQLSAGEAVARMCRGEITAERYARVLLARSESLRALNAFITLEPSRVLEAARACDKHRHSGGNLGPLFGLPIPVKDSVNTRDYPTSAGTPALRDFQPAADAPIVRSLRASGAIVLGKTNLHELSYGWTSNNLAFGAVHNPYDPTRIPGGSSGGTAGGGAARRPRCAASWASGPPRGRIPPSGRSPLVHCSIKQVPKRARWPTSRSSIAWPVAICATSTPCLSKACASVCGAAIGSRGSIPRSSALRARPSRRCAQRVSRLSKPKYRA